MTGRPGGFGAGAAVTSADDVGMSSNTPDASEARASNGRQPGPVRAGGGTPGARNLSQNQASPTGGVDDPTAVPPDARRGVTPDA